MSFIQENTININLNLKRKYNLYHFSDVHVVNLENIEGDEEIKKAHNNENAWYRVRQDFANHFKETCNMEQLLPSTKCLDNLLNHCLNKNIDALLLSGDIIDYISEANLSYLKESIKKIKVPFVLSPGNHEIPGSVFNEIINASSDFQVIDLEEIKIIGLDNSKKCFTLKQLEMLKKQCEDNKIIFLCMHIPILTKYNKEEMSKFDSYFIINENSCDQESKDFIDYISNNTNIKAIFCGHTHGASETFFAINKKQYCASSGLIGYVNHIIVK